MNTDVIFKNGGFPVAGNVCTSDQLAPGKHPAIVVGHPASGATEPAAGLHAQRLADQGFIKLAFGICASGGYVIPATATDYRVEAIATVSGVDPGTWDRGGADGAQVAAAACRNNDRGHRGGDEVNGEDAIKRAGEPKELFRIERAGDVDLYHQPEFVTPAVAKTH